MVLSTLKCHCHSLWLPIKNNYLGMVEKALKTPIWRNRTALPTYVNGAIDTGRQFAALSCDPDSAHHSQRVRRPR